MRLQLFAAAALLLPATSVAADDDARVMMTKAPQQVQNPGPAQQKLKLINPVPEKCPSLAAQTARKRGESPAPDKLTELPPGEAFHAVYRVGPDGCPDPIMVGYQYRQDR